MSARLKLKKLKRHMEYLDRCRSRAEAEARYEKVRCYNLLQKNVVEIGACVDLYPADTYRAANECLNANIRAVTSAIVREYTQQLTEYVRDELLSKYAFNSFGRFSVTLLAPAINENHIKVKVR